MEGTVVFDNITVQQIIPHRYPFLLIDKVIEFVDNEKCVGIKNVTANEPFFVGHFPGRPIMPGVLIVESMAQVGAVLAKKSTDGVGANKAIVLVGANDLRFKRQVVPGDTLRVEMRSVRKRRPLWIMSGEVTVEGRVVASGSISAMEVD
jgi:3-hydroxyacyl-[acyl-carrier-protein] dehydratase